MTMTVEPAERALHPTILAVGDEPRRPRPLSADGSRSEPATGHSDFDAAAPVSVNPDTEAAVADLHAVDAVPLATALGRYNEEC